MAGLILSAAAQKAAAADFTWIGAIDGDQAWEDPANWSSPTPGSLPTSTDDVTIPAASGVVVVDDREALTLQVHGGINVHRDAILTVGSGIVHDGTDYFINDGEINANIDNNGYISSTYRITGDLGNEAGDVYNDGAEAVWRGDLLTNGGGLWNKGGEWKGSIQGNSNYVQSYGTATWQGEVVANEGDIENIEFSQWTGDVLGNEGTIGNRDSAVWTGDVASNAGTIDNSSQWKGAVLGNTGTISSNGIWNGSITSSGMLLLGNEVNGAIDNSGTLQVSADLSGITTLTSTGTVDMISSETQDRVVGRTLSAVTVDFGANSRLLVGIDATGASDAIVTSGAAMLAGTVEVTAAGGGLYNPNTSYTILTAQSITGQFAGVTTNLGLAFLDPEFSQDAKTVRLSFERNLTSFGSVGITPTEMQIGGIVENTGSGNAIYDAVLWLSPDQAEGAFNALSGEAYLATEHALIQSAQWVGDSIASRLDRSFDGPGAGNGGGGSGPAGIPQPGDGSGLWGQVYGAIGQIAADGAIAGTDIKTGGLLAGLDGMLGDWRLGLVLDAGATVSKVSALGSSATSTDYGIGIYGGRQWGATRLSLGATYTGHDIESTRDVSFPGFEETLSSDYGAGTGLAFASLSHEFQLDGLSITPYGSVSHVRQSTDGFVESGGDAALTGGPDVVEATFTAIGLGLARRFTVGDGMLVTASGSLGWRHSFADDLETTHRFVDGGDSFSVIGAPLAGDTALVSAGLDIDLNAANSIDVRYDGQIGSGSQIHGLKASWNWQF